MNGFDQNNKEIKVGDIVGRPLSQDGPWIVQAILDDNNIQVTSNNPKFKADTFTIFPGNTLSKDDLTVRE